MIKFSISNKLQTTNTREPIYSYLGSLTYTNVNME